MNKPNRRPTLSDPQRPAVNRLDEAMRREWERVWERLRQPAGESAAERLRQFISDADADRRRTLAALVAAPPEREVWGLPALLTPCPEAAPPAGAAVTPAKPKRTRRTALIDAMDTMRRALARTRKREPSPRETWDAFKATKDPTGAVVRVDDDVIVWRDRNGVEHATKYKTFANSFGTLKARG